MAGCLDPLIAAQCLYLCFLPLRVRSLDYVTGVPRGEKALGYVSTSFIIHLPFSLGSVTSPCVSVREDLIWTSGWHSVHSVFCRWTSLMGRTWPRQWTSPACRWEPFTFLSETSISDLRVLSNSQVCGRFPVIGRDWLESRRTDREAHRWLGRQRWTDGW